MNWKSNLWNASGSFMYVQRHIVARSLNVLKPTGHVMHQQFNI